MSEPDLPVGADEISPSEMLRRLLSDELPEDLIPGGVTIGPVSREQLELGCISLMDAGLPEVEDYAPLVWVRAQIRCLAPTLDQIDRIARKTAGRLHQRGRTLLVQDSTDSVYLAHSFSVTAGPSMHRDTDENFEALLFAEICIGLEPVSDS